jgi:hypothetical protein
MAWISSGQMIGGRHEGGGWRVNGERLTHIPYRSVMDNVMNEQLWGERERERREGGWRQWHFGHLEKNWLKKVKWLRWHIEGGDD